MPWGRLYFAVQALGGAAWWVAVALVPAVRIATLGSLDPVPVAALDLPLFVGASALAAAGIRWAAVTATAWTLLVAVALAVWATLTGEAGDASRLQRELTMKDLLPGSGATTTVHFVGPADDKPVKFVLEITPAPGLPYVKDPSFRVDLTKGR